MKLFVSIFPASRPQFSFQQRQWTAQQDSNLFKPTSQPGKRLIKAKLENREPGLQPAYICIHPQATNTPPDLELAESPTTEELQSMRKSQSMKNTLGNLCKCCSLPPLQHWKALPAPSSSGSLCSPSLLLARGDL